MSSFQGHRSALMFSTSRRGISLLEVVVALMILAMSTAILAQIIQLATNNALQSRNELQASLICESKLAEFALNTLPMQSTGWLLITDLPYTTKQWYYRVDALGTAQPEIFSITVYVGDEFAAQNQVPPTASLTRWFIDPNLNLDMPADQSTTGATP